MQISKTKNKEKGEKVKTSNYGLLPNSCYSQHRRRFTIIPQVFTLKGKTVVRYYGGN